MPSAAAQVSTLADVLRLVQHVFSLMGDGTPLMIAEQYLHEPGPGSAPRVVFVPNKTGKLGPPLKLNAGYIASWTHGCEVYVRGAEPGDDPGRFEPAYALAGRVIDVIKALDPGHIVVAPGNPEDDSPLRVDSPPGADIKFTFTYATNIAQDPAVLRAVRLINSISPPNPDKPGGDTGNSFNVAALATAERP